MKPVSSCVHKEVQSWGDGGRPPYDRKVRRWVISLLQEFNDDPHWSQIRDWNLIFDLFTME